MQSPRCRVMTCSTIEDPGRPQAGRHGGKYRVMFIDGVCHPLHLAISRDWKVHYFTAAWRIAPRIGRKNAAS